MAGRRDGPLMRGGGGPSRGSRIAMAVAVGITLGCVFAFLFPDGFFRSNLAKFNSRSSLRSLQVTSSSCGNTDSLKSEISTLSQKNAELLNQINDLTSKLKQAVQSKDQVQTQLQFPLTQPKSAGPFGTVKSIRTNPPLLPDPSVNPKLSQLLETISPSKEVIIALANSNVKDMLILWFESIKRIKIQNYLVVALDDQIERLCTENEVPVYRKVLDNDRLDSVAKTGSNHAVSGLKFRVLREFLQLGYSVLLSDVDIIYLQNPFDHLYRDCDVESMSDGHDNLTAYGYDNVFDEPLMGWSRYAHTMRIWVFNSGFFYIRPTVPSVELLDRVADRLARENVWDQAAFNEELFFPSSPGYDGLHASRRAMDIYLFMNSKVLFKTVRRDERLRKIMPVVVHVNYHPDKVHRMRAVVDFYVHGKLNALEPFPVGSDW